MEAGSSSSNMEGMSNALSAWTKPLDGEGLRMSWDAQWLGLGAQPPVGLYETLLAAWSEPHRHYHDLRHLGECLALLDRWGGAAQRPAEIGLALWFHDAIYDVTAKDNEHRSAEWVGRVMQQAGAQLDAVQRVQHLIMVTKHDGGVETADEALMLDIDLAILGSPRARFAEYDRAVTEEYNWVPQLVFRDKRLALLERLKRSDLYRTPEARATLLAQAQSNLSWAIQRLSST